MDNETNLPARRLPGEPMESWRPRRDALARQLADLGPPAVNGVVEELRQQIQQLTGIIESLGSAVDSMGEHLREIQSGLDAPRGESPREVKLADGRTFCLVPHDFLAVSMAAIVASRTGEAVDVPLSDGSMAEGLRLGEIAEIARQLMTATENAG